jgi:PRTRC genetic system ThiF family protein
MPSQIDLAYVNAAPVVLPQRSKLRIALIGCGGTGSWLAPAIARLARVLNEQGQTVEVVFVDPDTVEVANVPRQNFCDAEIGRFKAETLAMRFSAAWGIPIRVIPARFDAAAVFAPHEWDTLTILVGCVDNPAARQSIANALTGNPSRPGTIWWLDCGNGRDNGQVLLGNAAHHRDLRAAFQIETLCAALPSPALLHPELLTATPDAAPPPLGGTCAQIARRHAQSLMVNQRVASEAADYLARLLLARGSRDGGLCRFATYFDLASGSARSLYTTPATVAAALHTTPVKLFGRRKQEKAK